MSSIYALLRTWLGHLPFSLRYELFYQSARSLGVESYEVAGSYGKFFGPLYDQSITKNYLRSGIWSPYIVSLFADFFAKSGGGTFCDIGANLGLVTVPIARNPQVTCFAFEPDRINFQLLRANIQRLCQHNNVNLFDAAVYDQNTELSFSRDSYNSGDHHIVAGETKIKIPAITLDSVVTPTPNLAIKVDTQGAEPAVFAGGRNAFGSSRLVVTEFWPMGMKRLGYDPSELIVQVGKFPFGQIIDHDVPGPWQPIGDICRILEERVNNLDGNTYFDLALERR